MKRKTGQQEPDQVERDDLSMVEEFDGEEMQLSPSVSGRIYTFLERIDLEDLTPVYYLSKYENYTSGETKAFLHKFEDCEPPDEYLIGKMYGSGRYLLTCVIPPVRGKTKGFTRMYRFRVSPSFDQANQAPPESGSALPVRQYSPEANFVQSFSMFEKMLALLIPLFNRPRDENVLGILNQNYTAVNELLKKQMGENLRLLNDYQRNVADLGELMIETEKEEIETEDTPNILEQFAPLIQQWLPLLLGKGPQAKAAGAVVSAVPQVQQIFKDKIELRKIINYLDQSQGPEATNKILANLKITRAGKKPVAVQQPAAPQGAGKVRKRPVK